MQEGMTCAQEGTPLKSPFNGFKLRRPGIAFVRLSRETRRRLYIILIFLFLYFGVLKQTVSK